MADEETQVDETPQVEEPTPEPESPEPDMVRRERDELRKFKEHTARLMSGTGDETELQDSMRHVMLNTGWSVAEVEQWMQQQQQPEGAPAPEPDETELSPMLPTPNSTGGPEVEELKQQLAEMQQRLQEQETRGDKVSLETARRDLNDAVQGILDRDDGIKLLLNKSKELGGTDEAQTELANQVRQTILERVRSRRAREGRFDPRMFAEESAEAANQVIKRYRSVIGDPDLIQRAPETATGYDRLLREKPVPPPEFSKGDDRGAVDTKVRSWTEDTLNRLVAESASGGKSRA